MKTMQGSMYVFGGNCVVMIVLSTMPIWRSLAFHYGQIYKERHGHGFIALWKGSDEKEWLGMNKGFVDRQNITTRKENARVTKS